MIVITHYAFKSDADAKQRLEDRTVELPVPKFWGGYFAVLRNHRALNQGVYKLCWFASNKGKKIKNAVAVIENN